MKKIVITGASGFIGSALMRHINRESLIGITRNPKNNLDYLTYVEDFKELPRGDILIYLSEEKDRAKANMLERKHVDMSVSMLKDAIRSGFSHIIYASSSYVYPDTECDTLKTDCHVVASDYYTEAKLINESIVLEEGGTVVRLSNVVGKFASVGVIYEILKSILEQSDVCLNDLSPVRDFISIDDVVSCIINIVQHPKAGIFNVGTGVGTSIKDLAEKIISFSPDYSGKLLSKKVLCSHSSIVLNIENTIKQFNWFPKKNTDHILNDLLKMVVL
jgi:nucleoside-diphosphate-sugar epimerase